MKRTSFISVAALTWGILSACHDAPQDAPMEDQTVPASTPAKETNFELDLDEDGKPDSIVLRSPELPDGPGKYIQLIVKFANGKVEELSGYWDDARKDEHEWSGNLLSTQSIYVARFVEAGTLLFLFGEDVGCCLQSLQILQVSGNGLTPYYSQNGFRFTKELQPMSDGITYLSGFPSYTQGGGTSAPDAEKDAAYLPTVVVRLGQRAEVDVEASAEATRERIGGFAGIKYREDISAITTASGEKYLWDEKEKRRLP